MLAREREIIKVAPVVVVEAAAGIANSVTLLLVVSLSKEVEIRKVDKAVTSPA